MADSTSKWRAVIIAAVGLVAAVGIAFWLLRPHGAEPRPAPRKTEEMLPLIALKNFAVGSLENLPNDASDGSECIAAFTQLAEKLPDEPLGLRNLAIARVVVVSKLDRETDREQAMQTVQQAETALQKLKEAEGESAIVHLLAANLAKLVGAKQLLPSEQQVIRELSAAARMLPDDVAAWGELYLSARHSRDLRVKAIASDALRRAYRLRPDNLVLLTEWLLLQAEAKDPAIVETLSAAKNTLRPYAGTMRQRGVELSQWLDDAIVAATAGDDAGWQRVFAKVRPLVNVMKPEMAYQHDLRRLQRHVLEYLIHDFSPKFYEQAKLPEAAHPPAIAVKLVPAPDEEQLPQLAGVRDVILADFDLDGRLDVVALVEDKVAVYGRDKGTGSWRLLAEAALPAGMAGILAADLDRDSHESTAHHSNQAVQPEPQQNGAENLEEGKGQLAACQVADVDLIVYGTAGVRLLKNHFGKETSKRTLQIVPQAAAFDGLTNVLATGTADLDHDGDLDLVISTDSGISLWSNRENFTFEDISTKSSLPPTEWKATTILPVDWDRNVSVDLLLASPQANEAGYLENDLHGRFRWRKFEPEFDKLAGAASLALADVDGNVSWDVLACGTKGVTLTQTRMPRAGVVRFLQSSAVAKTPAAGMTTWDFDNDGYLDVVAMSESGVEVYRGLPDGRFQLVGELFDEPPNGVTTCDVGDLDGDGDVDLLAAGPERLTWYRNEGGNRNHWIDITLSAEPNPASPSQRVNIHGIGSLLELNSGTIYQAQVVTRQTTHFGIGQRERADVVRQLWTNGIPQNVLRPETNQVICEVERLLIGSCPYLYTWTGSKYEFLTDLLWAAPIGLQLAEGVLAPAREWEYLKIPGDRLVAKDGEYHLQITEELWEAAYFDKVKLIAVDHPANVDIYSNEKVGPAEIAQFKIHTVANPRVPVAARDSRGRDVLDIVARRDNRYLKAFEQRIKQGLTPEHFVELDLGKLKDPQQITLFLTGWIFPTDTSLNVAISQNPNVSAAQPPSVWVPDEQGRWQQVIPYMGFPGGKTKTIAVDLSHAFLTDDYRVRIVTTMEIYWDAIFFSVDETPAACRRTELSAISADLHYRGFSRRMLHPGFGPESYEYNQVSTQPRWPPMAGRFTRYGDVTKLIQQADDLLVVLGAGDEMTLRFPVPDKGPPPGWTRDFILHNVGWDKDANLNTVYGQTVEPLPFRAMRNYPYAPAESYPDTPRHRNYLRDYQTRTQNHAAFWRQIGRHRQD